MMSIVEPSTEVAVDKLIVEEPQVDSSVNEMRKVYNAKQKQKKQELLEKVKA
jgi:hypothetical protein